jgi:hypothetical protein
VEIGVNMWFSSCKVARIKCNTLACVQEAILYVYVSQLWHELLGCFLCDVPCVWLSVSQWHILRKNLDYNITDKSKKKTDPF